MSFGAPQALSRVQPRVCCYCGKECVVGSRGDQLVIKPLQKKPHHNDYYHFGCWRAQRDPKLDPWGIDEKTPQEVSTPMPLAGGKKIQAVLQQADLPMQGSSWDGEW